MARSLSRTLTHLASISTTTTRTTAPATRLVYLRHQSNQSKILDKAAAKEEKEKLAVKKLEDAIHRIIVKKSQPDWLPLVPGGSYWVPPKMKARGFAEVVGKLVKSSTNSRAGLKDDKPFGLSSNRGWPSSAHFFKGASHSPLEGETTSKHTSKIEEEEG